MRHGLDRDPVVIVPPIFKGDDEMRALRDKVRERLLRVKAAVRKAVQEKKNK